MYHKKKIREGEPAEYLHGNNITEEKSLRD